MIDDEEDAGLDDEALIGDADFDEGGIDEGDEDTRQLESDGGDDGDSKDEAEAQQMGWKPLSEWKGDKSGWVDAKTFLDQVKPARLRDTLHKTSKELAELKQQREAEKRDFEDRLARLDKMNAKAMTQQRKQLMAQLKAAQRQAAEAGDVEAFDHFQEQEVQAQEHFAKEDEELEEAAPKKQPQQSKPDPTIDAWVKKNPAVRFSDPKWQAAIGFFSEAEAENPDGTIADHLAHVEARLNEVWPGTVRGTKAKQNGNGAMNGKRDDDKGQRSPQTERSGRMAARPGARGKGWTDIPTAERGIMARHIKEGLYKDEADAAKAYWS